MGGSQVAPALHTVTLRNYGNGAAGFSGCSTSPTVSGSNGGTGGDLTVPFSVAHDVQDSFYGGRAADGNPPGAKGTGGTFSKNGQRFPDGQIGASCGGASGIQFSESEVSLFTNEEKPVTLTRTGPLAQVQRAISVTIRSEDGGVVLVRNVADNTVAKSHTILWPIGLPSLNLRIVGGAYIHDAYNIVARIDDLEFGTPNATLGVTNSQRLTTTVELQGVNGTQIPAGTVFDYTPTSASRLRGIVITPPNARCSSWHGVPQGSSAGSGVTVDDEMVFTSGDESCGYGLVIQPTNPTDRSRSAPKAK